MYKKWIGVALLCAVAAIGLEFYLVKSLWAEPAEREAYVLKTDMEAGQCVQEKDLQIIWLKSGSNLEGVIKDEFKWMGKAITKDVPAGKLLTVSDFETSDEAINQESIVLRLDYEQGHKGDLGIGEKISFLCYRQGEVKLISNLTVSGKEKDLQNVGGEGYYLTVSGKAEALEILVLAKKEGSVHVLKKTAVHN